MNAYPLVYPLALLSAPENHLQNARSGSPADDDSCVCASPTSANTPARADSLSAERVQSQLCGRDLAVVASVRLFKYMSARQIEALHFSAHASRRTAARICRRVLERLTAAGVLWRLARRVGGLRAGSSSYVYAVTTRGLWLLDSAAGKRGRRSEPSEEFLAHTLAVTQLAVDLQELSRAGDAVELIEVMPEPHCWRSFSAAAGGIETLKPDLFIALARGEYEYQWFTEVDLGTHGSGAIVSKCRQYQRYWQSGAEQQASGLFPRVLFVAPHERRARFLTRAIAKARCLKGELFAVTTTEQALAVLTGGQS